MSRSIAVSAAPLQSVTSALGIRVAATAMPFSPALSSSASQQDGARVYSRKAHAVGDEAGDRRRMHLANISSATSQPKKWSSSRMRRRSDVGFSHAMRRMSVRTCRSRPHSPLRLQVPRTSWRRRSGRRCPDRASRSTTAYGGVDALVTGYLPAVGRERSKVGSVEDDVAVRVGRLDSHLLFHREPSCRSASVLWLGEPIQCKPH